MSGSHLVRCPVALGLGLAPLGRNPNLRLLPVLGIQTQPLTPGQQLQHLQEQRLGDSVCLSEVALPLPLCLPGDLEYLSWGMGMNVGSHAGRGSPACTSVACCSLMGNAGWNVSMGLQRG